MRFVSALKTYMAEPQIICVEVAYATPQQQWLISVDVPAGATLAQAIALSGIEQHCPDIDVQSATVGVYGQIKNLNDRLRAGDRVEIYRPLLIDPKELRRQRAAGAKSISKPRRR